MGTDSAADGRVRKSTRPTRGYQPAAATREWRAGGSPAVRPSPLQLLVEWFLPGRSIVGRSGCPARTYLMTRPVKA
jgi:hypothetical protein